MDDELRQLQEEAEAFRAHEEHREYLLTVVWRNGSMVEKVIGSRKVHKKVEDIQKVGLGTYGFEKAKLFLEIIPFHAIEKIVVEEQ
ncbi:MAG: hypothetical protein AAB916_00255 [Patescibacteria group bacterium]